MKSLTRRRGDGDETMGTGMDGDGNVPAPSAQEIDAEWEKTSLIGTVVRNAKRKAGGGSKNEKRVVRNVVEAGGDPELMYLLLTGVIAAWREAGVCSVGEGDTEDSLPITPDTLDTSNTSNSTTTTTASTTNPLPSLYNLTATNAAYTNPHTTLAKTASSHLYLLTLLPPPLHPYHTPHQTHNIITRAAHNAFSLRPSTTSPSHSTSPTSPTTNNNTSDGPDSGEFLGYATYPTASFFNHSCAPNLRKRRVGRVFEFFADRDVAVGEELCISYLGGEEGVLGVGERRGRLRGEWGFECGCGRCVDEEMGEGRRGGVGE